MATTKKCLERMKKNMITTETLNTS